MAKINIKDIESLSFDEGKKVLLDNGYIESNTSREEEVASCDYAEDFYFTLFDEDDNEAPQVAYSIFYNRGNSEDGSDDIVVKQYWNEL